MASPQRSYVLWIGPSPNAQVVESFNVRGLFLREIGASDGTDGQMSASRGLVIIVSKATDILDFQPYSKTLNLALIHGLKTFVLCELQAVPAAWQFLRTLPFGARVIVRTLENASKVALDLTGYDSGPAWSDSVEISGGESLVSEEDILIRRAFGDCNTAAMVAQSGGRSAKVYCVYARLADSRAGPLPLPFFAKIDKVAKIVRELENYRECTTLFVPFNQRPNLDPQRCALGAERGIIVGNYIEESEPLRSLVERGTARGALNSLFGGALRGWRNQAYFDESMVRNGSLALAVEQCLPSHMPSWRRSILQRHAAAARSFGANLGVKHLEELIRRLPDMRYRCAMMHGDLHGDNVRVHRGEAILIDFASCSRGPLVNDPASLDVALVMQTDTVLGADWIGFAERIYGIDALLDLPAPPDPIEYAAGLWQSIRLVRQIAMADVMTTGEYALAIALQLLRRASYPPSKGEERNRRALAYALAERIALAMQQRIGGGSSSKDTGKADATG
jgi:Phosphotransferase enzyme family